MKGPANNWKKLCPIRLLTPADGVFSSHLGQFTGVRGWRNTVGTLIRACLVQEASRAPPFACSERRGAASSSRSCQTVPFANITVACYFNVGRKIRKHVCKLFTSTLKRGERGFVESEISKSVCSRVLRQPLKESIPLGVSSEPSGDLR